jgi:predicted MFS family arabinose efflux permease
VLIDVFHWSWRSIFLINVPVSIFVVIAALAVVPESRAPHARRLDPGGVFLASGALFALVFGLIEGRQYGWPTWTILLMVAAAPLFVCFARYERRHEARGHSPLVSTSLFRERAFSSGLIVIVVFFTGLVGFFLAFTVFLQLGLGWRPLESALTTFPSSVGLAVTSQIGGKLAPRFGRRLLAVGALIMAIAMAGLVATIHVHGAALTAWDVRPVIFVFGLGMGLIVPPLADVILAGVHERHAGAASGVVNTAMQVGNAVGVAVIGVILFGAIAAQAPSSVAKVQPELSRQLIAAGVPDSVREGAITQFRHCLVDRSRTEDPAATPASCRRDAAALPTPMRDKLFTALDAAANRGRADDFVASIQRAVVYEVGVFVATVALLLLLPFRPKRTRTPMP